MAGKLLSFLGTGDYKETAYYLGEREHTTRYAPAALCHLLESAPKELVVFVTQEAEDKHGAGIREEIGECVPLRLVRIPAGASEEEMWAIFGIITAQVEEGDRLYFDITHSFRSLPFLSFLALAYLRTAKRAEIAGVYYGAYEAKQDSRTPVFDLTPFIELLDWTVAADRFIRFGDGRDLAELARRVKREWVDHGGVDKGDVFAWGRLADKLLAVSHSLRLIRPDDAMQEAYNLQEHLRQHFANSVERRAQIAPLTVLLEKVSNAFAPLALKEPRQDWRENLRRQKELIRWYLDHQQYVHSLALAREWLVSWIVAWMDSPENMYKREQREEAEKVLNRAGRRRRDKSAGAVGKPGEAGEVPVPIPEEVTELWTQITERRNDILHAGMREQTAKAEKVIEGVESFVARIEKLTLPGDTEDTA